MPSAPAPELGLAKYPRWLGYWPAAAGLIAFVWTELVFPDAGYVSTVIAWMLLYMGVTLLGAAIYGSSWFENADPFEVYFSLVARLSPWGRLRDTDATRTGRIAIRNPLDNLDSQPVRPGLVAVLTVLLGSTAFDSFSAANYWLATTAQPGGFDPVLRDTLVLIAFVAFVAVTFVAGAVITSGLTRSQRRTMQVSWRTVWCRSSSATSSLTT